jgi:hypothetical protein
MLSATISPKFVCRELQLDLPQPNLKEWNEMLDRVRRSKEHDEDRPRRQVLSSFTPRISPLRRPCATRATKQRVVEIEWIDQKPSTQKM